jgi:hypothetical protein
MHHLLVVRDRLTPEWTQGVLYINEERFCYTLERAEHDPEHPAIPVGTYTVELTVSPRVVAGTLWSPDKEHRLPLIIVPGRTGIRIHAANFATQLEGCIAVGEERMQDGSILRSRSALTTLMARLTYPIPLTIERKPEP